MNLSHPLDDLVGRNAGRLLERLASVADGLTGRRLAELSETPVGTTQRALAHLEHVGLVRSRQVGRAILHTLNRDHLLWAVLSEAMNSRASLEQRIAERGQQLGGVGTTVALYGSTARNSADGDSDIDLLVLWDESLSQDKRDGLLAALSDDVSNLTGNPTELVDISAADLKRLVSANDPLVASWKRDARTLSGPDLKMQIRLASV
ncbi:nucleotidyltransferase domain-containing protein [Subtercola endophyticus]|uniref:nucleotidyltransferase domain-containing protein n=1 Tax=Subtercola endophyticus TaxID=2895559 RepID=UPI001E59BF5C|nr:nucleotidyltransferase domain-containing protein [Subtercola endophyticus]UFS60254.1 nucleotidyltransferase domain-containing protein [Subtercola endophyticus]